MRASDALGPLVEFFELHADGADLPADICQGFRDALADIRASVQRLESIVDRHLASMSKDEPWGEPTTYTYGHALEHQRNRDLVRQAAIRMDDKVIALPNTFRQEAAARLAAVEASP